MTNGCHPPKRIAVKSETKKENPPRRRPAVECRKKETEAR